MNDKSPWKGNRRAFDVMFDDEAEFCLEDGRRSTVKCCVFPTESVDPFADSDNESAIKSVSVLVRRGDWFLFDEKPPVGAQITLPNGDTYKVQEATLEQDWWRVTGRSFK